MPKLSEAEQIITDLLRIAKVAMPGKLYDEDPRVIRARGWLDGAANADADIRLVETIIDGRPPNPVPGRVPTAGRKR